MDDNKTLLLKHLCNAFRDRGIPYKRDELKTALQNPDHARWVANNLNPEVFLSKDEVEVYAKLESSDALRETLQDPNLSLASTRPIHDDEINPAIESLQASTAAIDAQTGELKSQCKKLASILATQEDDGRRRDEVRRAFRDRNVEESQNINSTVDQLRRDFETDIETAWSVLEEEDNDLKPRVSTTLKEHDKILQRCEEIASRHLLEDTENDNEDMLKRVERLSAKLSNLLAEETRCRLDRVYLEDLQNNDSGESDDDNEQPGKLGSVEEEIGSLYSEIDVLTDMDSRQNFQIPALQTLQRRREGINSTSGKQLDNILSTIAKLTTSTEQLNERVQNRYSHRVALKELATAQENAKMSLQPMASTGASGEDRRKCNNQSVSTKVDDKFPSLTALLTRSGVSLSALQQCSYNAVHETLEGKMLSMRQSMEDDYASTPAALSNPLDTADKSAQLLTSSLHADYGANHEERTQKLAVLETQLERIQKGIGALDTDGLKGNPAQERFVEQWG